MSKNDPSNDPPHAQSEELPHAVWSGVFKIMGVEMKCHTLSDGRRIIEEESVEHFTRMLRAGSVPERSDGLEAFVRWQSGRAGLGRVVCFHCEKAPAPHLTVGGPMCTDCLSNCMDF